MSRKSNLPRDKNAKDIAAGPGRPAKGNLKKSAFLKVFMTPKHKEAVDAYCNERDMPVSTFMYQLIIQVVPDPET